MMEYRRCTRCVMTEKADPTISFDENGYCNYCTDALKQFNEIYFPNEEGARRLKELTDMLKEKNKDREFDCLMGISGGLDSAYLAYLGSQKWGLRIAAVHIDDGFDTEIAQSNIKKLCEKSGIELITIHPDAEQFNELSRAYILASVPNLAAPQDNVLFACIYKYAKERDIRDFLSGGNFSLECILQQGNTCNVFDVVNIRDINRRFGRCRIDKLPLLDSIGRYENARRMQIFEARPLNYIDYTRERALAELEEFCGFEYYGSKHLENYFTGFLQLYWLPEKFGVDKRTSHLSSMIVTGQMTRDEALKKLEEPMCAEEWLNKAISLVKEKLDLSDEEFDAALKAEPRQHNYYKTDKIFPIYRDLGKTVRKVQRRLGLIK